MDYSTILFSREHLAQPFTIRLKDHNLSITDKKAQTIALSIIVGIFTAVLGGIVLLYCLTAYHKFNHIKQNEKIISNGFGEFIVYKKLKDGTQEPISEEIHEQVYDILLQHAPSSFQSADSKEVWINQFEKREDIILQKVKEIDPDIEITFIPRTLYELMLIHECIEEDLQAKSICEALSPMEQQLLQYPKFNLRLFKNCSNDEILGFQNDIRSKQKQRNCWHLCYFDDVGDDKCKEVKAVAYRINQVAAKKLGSNTGALSYQKISELAESELDYLKKYYQDCQVTSQRIFSTAHPGPTSNFGYESYGGIKPTGIRNDEDAKIIRNAIALECSEIAKKNVFIYRGGTFKNDTPYRNSDKNSPFSLSYGTSLFAGIMYDGGATPFHFMRKDKQDAYAIKIPFEELQESPFFTPLTHPVCQLFGDGEIFHARSKVWKGVISTPSGIQQGETRWEHLKTDIERSELVKNFQGYYKKNAVFLK